MGNEVKFINITQDQYDAINDKDAGALYFISDTKRVYKGDDLFQPELVPMYESTDEQPKGKGYSGTKYSRWTVLRDEEDVSGEVAQPSWVDSGEHPSTWAVGFIEADSLDTYYVSGSDDDLTLEWEYSDGVNVHQYVAERHENSIIGYTLGNQPEYPLQPKGNYLTEHQDISGKEDSSNKVTSVSDQSTHTQYPSAKCMYDTIDAAINGRFQKVDQLPQEGEENVIYLVPREDEHNQLMKNAMSRGDDDPATEESDEGFSGPVNVLDEYIWVDDVWEKIGSTDIDLSGYKPKQTAVYDPSVPSSGTTTSLTFIDTISQDENGVITPTKKTVAGAVASSSGQGGSAGLMTAADKEKLSGVAPGAQVNVIETVKVNGAALTPTNKEVDVVVPEQEQSNWNETNSSAKSFIKNKPTIPTVPAISNSINIDAMSTTKTVSPKAVKDFVQGKGYLVRQDILGRMSLPPIANGWDPYRLGTQESMEVPGSPLPEAWYPMRLRYTPDESDPNFVVEAELEIDENYNQPVSLDFEYEGDISSWGIFYSSEFTVVNKGNSEYEVGDQWYPDEPVLASYLYLDGTLGEASGATLVSTAGGVESPVPSDTIPVQTSYMVDLFLGWTTVLSNSYTGGGSFPRYMIIGLFDLPYGMDPGHFNPNGTYHPGDLCYGPQAVGDEDYSAYEWTLCICTNDYDPSYYEFEFPGQCFAPVKTDTRLVLVNSDSENAVRAPELGWNDCVAVYPTNVDDLRAGTYDSETGEYILGDPEAVNVFDIDQLTDPLDPMFGRSFTVTKKVYQRPEYPGYDPSLEEYNW